MLFISIMTQVGDSQVQKLGFIITDKVEEKRVGLQDASCGVTDFDADEGAGEGPLFYLLVIAAVLRALK